MQRGDDGEGMKTCSPGANRNRWDGGYTAKNRRGLHSKTIAIVLLLDSHVQSAREGQSSGIMAKDVYQPMSSDKKDDTAHPADRSIEQPSNNYWPTIAHRDSIPKWLRDNDFILTGHPMPTNSYPKSFRLWRCLHMETMNIWTHFLGSAAFVATGAMLYYEIKQTKPTTGDIFAFGASISSAAICFGLSATFHTLRSHSYNVHHFWGKMDILGICVLALGGGVSATYYAAFEQVMLQRAYWSLSICSSAAAAYTLFETGGGGSKMRALRGGVFSLLALSAMLPIFHGVAVHGWQDACYRFGAQWFLAEGLLLLLGVGTFVGRVPERLSPGTFDIWGHSHQIFHTCAVVGTACHLMALSAGFGYQHSGL